MKAIFASLLGGWVLLAAAAQTEPAWEDSQEQWQFVAREAQLLLEQTPQDDWWARASLAALMHPHADASEEWENLAVLALRDQEIEQLRVAALAAPEGTSERLRLRLFEAWMAAEPENLAPALNHALLHADDVLERLEDVAGFERHDLGLFPIAERLEQALPEATPVPIAFTFQDHGVGDASDMIWQKVMGFALPAYQGMPCLNAEYVEAMATQNDDRCLLLGRLMENTATTLVHNMMGIAMQRVWYETQENHTHAQAAQERRDHLSERMAEVLPGALVDREAFVRWRALLVEYGELGTLRWLGRNCEDFDSNEACLKASEQ